MRRPNGHRRPLGTTTRVRFDWNGPPSREPQLGSVTLERGTARWYLLVGVGEHRDSPRVWWLTLERIAPADGWARVRAGAPAWHHVCYRR